MARAELTIDLPDSVWISEISTTYPDTLFRVLAAFPDEEHGVALLDVSGPDVVEALQAMHESDAVTQLDPLEQDDDSVLVQFETDEPLLLFSLREAGLPLEPPLEISDGKGTLEVVAPHAKLSQLREQLDAFGMDFEVGYLYESGDSERLLTPRQQEVLVAAIEAGYYDTPRESTLTDLADDLDTAKSTLSETLHRAEETAIKQFATNLPAFDQEELTA
ncbi:helix-turn-helix domain-containing protein [Halobacterium rubrum]|uniref:helix-turn-helix domain-containing protein n=1 Tax=Halobacterium TaxID=2239 RepID=UPI001F3EE820|nr:MULTISPECIES: helix-turn-helix domain-containing protein [Halobacterium]MDH5019962.1 helix-turn-helix domain-containing protein [Halobacterium rubrum]